ncbi:MAG: right-handed parallel beta-helix repeat-containing protein, partial [Sphingomonadaceae bacterium]
MSPLVLALTASAITIAAWPLASAWAGQPQFSVKESGRSFNTLQQAVDAVGDGQGTVLIAPGTYRECAVQQGGDVSYEAIRPGTAIFEGVTCEGKAALVLRGRNANISGLVFRKMAVPDFNGAGI